MKRVTIAMAIVAMMCVMPFCGMDTSGEPDMTTPPVDITGDDSESSMGDIMEVLSIFNSFSQFEIPDEDKDNYDEWSGNVTIDGDSYTDNTRILEKNVVVDNGATITFANGGILGVPAGMMFIINGSVDFVCNGSDSDSAVDIQLYYDKSTEKRGEICFGNLKPITESEGDVLIYSEASFGVTLKMSDGDTTSYSLVLDIRGNDEEDSISIGADDSHFPLIDIPNNPNGKELTLNVKFGLEGIDMSFVSDTMNFDEMEINNISASFKVTVSGLKDLIAGIGGDSVDDLSNINLSVVLQADISVDSASMEMEDDLGNKDTMALEGLHVHIGGKVLTDLSATLTLDSLSIHDDRMDLDVSDLKITAKSEYESIMSIIVAAIGVFGDSEDGESDDPSDSMIGSMVTDFLAAGSKSELNIEIGELSYSRGDTSVDLTRDDESAPALSLGIKVDTVGNDNEEGSPATFDIVLGLNLQMGDGAELLVIAEDDSGLDVYDLDIVGTLTIKEVDYGLLAGESPSTLLEKIVADVDLSADYILVQNVVEVRSADASIFTKICAWNIDLTVEANTTGDEQVFSINGSVSRLEVVNGEYDQEASIDMDEDHTCLTFTGLKISNGENDKILVDCGSANADIRRDTDVVTSVIGEGNNNTGYKFAFDVDEGFSYEVLGDETEIDGAVIFSVKKCTISGDSIAEAGKTYPAGTAIAVEAAVGTEEGQVFLGWNVGGTEYFDGRLAYLPAGDVTISPMFTRLTNVEMGSTSVTTDTDDIAVTADDLKAMKSYAGEGTVDITFASGTISFSTAAIDRIVPASGNVAIRMAVGDTAPDMSNIRGSDKEMLNKATFISVNMVNVANTDELGEVKVSVPYSLPSGADADSVTVYYISENGNLVSMETVYSDGNVTFTTDHFSDYAIVAQVNGGGSDDGNLVLIVAVVAIVAILGCAAFFIMKKRSA